MLNPLSQVLIDDSPKAFVDTVQSATATQSDSQADRQQPTVPVDAGLKFTQLTKGIPCVCQIHNNFVHAHCMLH